MNLFDEIARLQQSATENRSAHDLLTNKYSKFKQAASQILVPYPLDELVEKASVDGSQLNDVAYRPRQLLANRHHSN